MFDPALLKRHWPVPDFSPVVIPERLLALNHPKFHRLVGGMVLKYTIAMCYLEKGEILDACCGSGFGAAILAASGFSVTGIDSDPMVLKLCENRTKVYSNLKFITKNLFHDSNLGVFDGATMIDSIEHFQKESQLEALIKLRSHVKQGKVIVLDTPLTRISHRQSRNHLWVLNWNDFGDLVTNAGMDITNRYIIRCVNGVQSISVEYTKEPTLDKEEYHNGVDQIIIARVR